MDVFLTETALRRLLHGKKHAPTLQQLAGKKVMVEILNIIEIINEKAYLMCYCCKFFGCALHFYSDNFYVCETCQLLTEFLSLIF